MVPKSHREEISLIYSSSLLKIEQGYIFHHNASLKPAAQQDEVSQLASSASKAMNLPSVFTYIVLFLLFHSAFGDIINFGQSCALTGSRSVLGPATSMGISAAFQEANDNQLLFNTTLNLIIRDDISDSNLAYQNALKFMQEDNVFALVGLPYYSYKASLQVLDELNITKMPIIGPISGAKDLRVPFKDNIINIRASFIDETGAMVKFLLSKQITRISLFYENSSAGFNALEGLKISLEKSDLVLESLGMYDPQTENVTEGIHNIFAGHHVQAIVFMGRAGPCAAAVKHALTMHSDGTYRFYFMFMSYFDPHEFIRLIEAENLPCTDIYATQVVPAHANSTLTGVKRFEAAMAKYFPLNDTSLASMEGYLVGQLIIETLDRIRGPLTHQSFLEAIYRTSLYYFGGVTLGPYLNDTDLERCNQGMHEVFLSRLEPWSHFEALTDFRFKWSDTCLSSRSDLFTSTRILWAQITDLTGPMKSWGLATNLGIAAAFSEVNRLNLIPGYTFELRIYDHKSSSQLAYQLADSIARNLTAFGVIGSVGAGPAAAIAKALADNGFPMPFVGAPTGAMALRQPFNRNIINIRASHIDEAGAIVSFLISSLAAHISVLYQNEEFGRAGIEATALALNNSGRSMDSFGTFESSTLDIVPGAQKILSHRKPDALIIIGVAEPVARAIQYFRNQTRGSEKPIIFFAYTDMEQFYAAMMALNEPFEHVHMTQVVPSPSNIEDPFIKRYLSALQAYSPEAQPSFASVEGYLSGLLVIEAAARIRGSITRDAFVNEVYESQLFVFSRLGLGPYSADPAASCNQGLKTVWMISLNETTVYRLENDSTFSWSDSCFSAKTDLARPLIFGQSAPLSGPTKALGRSFRAGILAAFNRFNRNGGINGRKVLLSSYDDGYNVTTTVENTYELIDDGLIALIGYVGTPTTLAAVSVSESTSIPFLAPLSGASILRRPCSKYVVNMRSSYADEAAAMVSFLLDDVHSTSRNHRVIRKIAAFFQQDDYGRYYEGAEVALKHRKMAISGLGHYHINTEDVENALANITAEGNVPDAIVLFGAYAPTAKFVKLAQEVLPRRTIFTATSFVGAELFSAELSKWGAFLTDEQDNPTVFITQVVPSHQDPKLPLAVEFREEMSYLSPPMDPNYISFEGYAAGRFATRALQLAEGEITPRSFIEAIYDKFIFNLGEFFLGPYTLTSQTRNYDGENIEAEVTTCSCSQGSHRVWMTYLNKNNEVKQFSNFSFTFETCGVVFEELALQVIPPAARGIILGLAVVSIILVIACSILVAQYRQTKTMSAASPVFLQILLLGALLLSISPFFAINWSDYETEAGNNHCMTWIWLLGLGFVLFFAPLAIKTYRVYRIFNNRMIAQVITIQDGDLMVYLSIPLLVELIILTLWTSLAPARLKLIRIPSSIDQTMLLCTSDNYSDQPFIITQAVFFSVLAIAACYFALRTRAIKYGAFRESSEILFAVYNLTFISVILVPLHAGLTYLVIPSTIIRTIGVLFLVLVSLVALFGIKLFRIITNNENMSSSTRRSGPTLTHSTSSGSMGHHHAAVSSYSIASSEIIGAHSENTATYLPSENTVVMRSEMTNMAMESESEDIVDRVGRFKKPKHSGKGNKAGGKKQIIDLRNLPPMKTLSMLESSGETDTNAALSSSGESAPSRRFKSVNSSASKK